MKHPCKSPNASTKEYFGNKPKNEPMNNRKKLLNLVSLFIVFFVCQNYAVPQQPWGLQKCVDYSIEHNIQVKQTQLKAKSSQSSLQQSKLKLAPSLNANASDAFQFGYTVDPYTNQFTNNRVQSLSASITGSVTLFSGLQQVNTIKENNYTLMSNLQEIEEVKYNITVSVATSYLQILFDKELLGVAKSQVEISKGQEQRTKILVDAGSLAKGNLLEVQAQLATEELNKINAENNLRTDYLNLTQLLELDSTAGFEIEVPVVEDPTEMNILDSVNSIYEKSLSLPQIKMQEYRLKSSEKSLAIAYGGLSPRLYLQGSYGTGYSNNRYKYATSPGNPVEVGYVGSSGDAVFAPSTTTTQSPYLFTDQFVDNRSLSIVIGIQIPLFNNFTVKNNITQSRISVDNSQYTLELSKRQLYKDIQQARNSAESALAKFKASQKAEEAQKESFSYTQQKFDLGLVNSVDYNTAKNQLTKVQSDKVQAKFDFLFRINILNYYMGIPFKL